jgi:hypothetical protein
MVTNSLRVSLCILSKLYVKNEDGTYRQYIYIYTCKSVYQHDYVIFIMLINILNLDLITSGIIYFFDHACIASQTNIVNQ